MKLWMLGSGSEGNAVLIECDGARVLIDAGFPMRTLARRLALIDVAPASIEACIITHEHSDHTRGAAMASRKWGWTLHASEGTIRGWPGLGEAGAHAFRAGDRIALTRMDVDTLPIPHDAEEAVGAVVTVRSSGARAGICYDIGHVSESVRAICTDVDVLVLEANHDEGMLRAGPYPYVVQQRIAGKHGHLSNREAAGLARDSVTPSLNHVVLAHLSQRCNDHGVARRAVNAGLTQAGFRGQLSTAMQHDVVGPFSPRSERSGPPAQYSLF